jgi:signal transduction histidine kinase
LAKKIVEDHKGRMEMQSKEGTGTTVTIILPVERRGDDTEQTKSEARS